MMASRATKAELMQAVRANLPVDGSKVLYADFLNDLQNSGNGAAAQLVYDMKQTGELQTELRENAEDPNKRDLFIGLSEIPF